MVRRRIPPRSSPKSWLAIRPVYPPLLMLVAVPLSLLPWGLAFGLWVVVGVASVLVALYVVGVRDVRCYCLALLCAPAMVGLTWGNATLLLLPLVALAWRWRSHAYRPGVVLGIAIAGKLFLWPLVFGSSAHAAIARP